MGHNLYLHFVDENPFATYVDVQQGHRVLTHTQIGLVQSPQNP